MLWSMGDRRERLHDAGCCNEQPVKANNLAASAASSKDEATGSPEEKVKMHERDGLAILSLVTS